MISSEGKMFFMLPHVTVERVLDNNWGLRSGAALSFHPLEQFPWQGKEIQWKEELPPQHIGPNGGGHQFITYLNEQFHVNQ